MTEKFCENYETKTRIELKEIESDVSRKIHIDEMRDKYKIFEN